MSLIEEQRTTMPAIERQELIEFLCKSGYITALSVGQQGIYLFGQTENQRAVCLAWGENEKGCITLDAVHCANREILAAGLKVPFLFFGRTRLCRQGDLFTFAQVPWCFEQQINVVLRILHQMNQREDLHVLASELEGTALLATRRETSITRFLRDYGQARQLLHAGMPFEIGRYTGRMIETDGQFHSWLLQGLNRKINTHGGILPERERWRRWDEDYQGRLWRDQHSLWQIRHLRHRIYQFETQEIRSRFGHLLACHEDD